MKSEKEIREAGAKLFPNWFTEYDEGRAFRGFEAGAKWAQEQDNWIDCETFQPSVTCDILVYYQNDSYGVQTYVPKHGFKRMPYVTHWQPLPKSNFLTTQEREEKTI